MKKNGFIATSILYSFFLVFCSLLVGILATSMHNRLLLNDVKDTIKKDLVNINNKGSYNLKAGDFLVMPLFKKGEGIYLKDSLWVVENINDNVIYVVSKEPILKTNKYTTSVIMQEELDKYYNQYTTTGFFPGSPHVTYLTRSKINEHKNISNELIKSSLYDVTNDYIYYDTNKFYLKRNCTLSACSEFGNNLISPNEYNVRLYAYLNNNIYIQSGTGSINNPYQISYYALDGLVLHYDSLNTTGNKGYITSNLTHVTDLSGNSQNGSAVDNYNIDSYYGVKVQLPNVIDTNLEFNSISNKNMTIEFRTGSRFSLAGSILGHTLINFNYDDTNNSHKLTLMAYIFPYNTQNFNYTYYNLKNENTVSIVVNDNKVKIYINGEFKEEVKQPIAFPEGNFKIGTYGNGIIGFKSLRIYNRQLTSEEVKTNYENDLRWYK